MELLQSGVDRSVIALWLGHESPETTQIYLEATLAMKEQAPHANPVKGTSVEQEEHPTTKDLVGALLELGKSEPRLTWVNCGLCVDERGAGHSIDGVKRGGPADFFTMAVESTTTLVIPTR